MRVRRSKGGLSGRVSSEGSSDVQLADFLDSFWGHCCCFAS